jgi:hypothetical protein
MSASCDERQLPRFRVCVVLSANLLGILVYGYATGVFSRRKLERATYDLGAFRSWDRDLLIRNPQANAA